MHRLPKEVDCQLLLLSRVLSISAFVQLSTMEGRGVSYALGLNHIFRYFSLSLASTDSARKPEVQQHHYSTLNRQPRHAPRPADSLSADLNRGDKDSAGHLSSRPAVAQGHAASIVIDDQGHGTAIAIDAKTIDRLRFWKSFSIKTPAPAYHSRHPILDNITFLSHSILAPSCPHSLVVYAQVNKTKNTLTLSRSTPAHGVSHGSTTSVQLTTS